MKSFDLTIIKISKWIITVIAVIIFAITLVYFFGKSITMDNHSMSNTINSGDNVLIDSLRYKVFDVSRFDVIYFYTSSDETSIKRVVGLPGERIKIDDGNIYIDGNLLELVDGMSSYDVAGVAEETYTLADDEYFVLGDNGGSSEDSRFMSIGCINKSDILGKVWLRLKPFGVIN